MHSYQGAARQDTANLKALSTIAKMAQSKSRSANLNKAKCKQREDQRLSQNRHEDDTALGKFQQM